MNHLSRLRKFKNLSNNLSNNFCCNLNSELSKLSHVSPFKSTFWKNWSLKARGSIPRARSLALPSKRANSIPILGFFQTDMKNSIKFASLWLSESVQCIYSLICSFSPMSMEKGPLPVKYGNPHFLEIAQGNNSSSMWSNASFVLVALCMDFLIDGQISSFCPDQHEGGILTLITLHKLTQSL